MTIGNSSNAYANVIVGVPLSNLTTSNKTNVVSAVNEVRANLIANVISIYEDFAPVQSGFEVDNFTLSFSNVSPDRTLSITGSGVLYSEGNRIEKTSITETVQIDDTEGLHFIYYDGSGVLQKTAVWSDDLIFDYALISQVYWNAANNMTIVAQNERHGREMPSATHLYLHETFGTRYDNGLGIGNITIGNGSSDTHRQFSVGSGETHDEDLKNVFSGLAFPAQIPIIYQLGSGGTWRMKTKNTFPYINSGSDVWTDGSGRPAYNKLTTGTWSLDVVPQNSFFCVHYFCIPGITEKIYGILGQALYGNSTAARSGAQVELLSIIDAGLPTAEWLAIGTVLFQSRNTNAVSIVGPSTGVNYVDWRNSPFVSVLTTASPTPSANQILVDASGFNGNLSNTDTNVQLALETIDALTVGAFPIGASGIGYGKYTFSVPNSSSGDNLHLQMYAYPQISTLNTDVGSGFSAPDLALNTATSEADWYVFNGVTVVGFPAAGVSPAYENSVVLCQDITLTGGGVPFVLYRWFVDGAPAVYGDWQFAYFG